MDGHIFVIFEVMHCDYILFQPGLFGIMSCTSKEFSGSPDFGTRILGVHPMQHSKSQSVHVSSIFLGGFVFGVP